MSRRLEKVKFQYNTTPSKIGGIEHGVMCKPSPLPDVIRLQERSRVENAANFSKKADVSSSGSKRN